MEDEKRKIEVDSFKVSQDIPKKSHFAIKYLVFVIILIGFTALATYFTIQNINKEANGKKNVVTEERNKTSNDEKYLISSYSDTYDNNSLNIIKYYDIDGKVSKDDNYFEEYNYRVIYVQIDGLKDKKIQNDINQKLRQKAYNLKHENTYSEICANFSNILSVMIYNDENKHDSLNVNLATGEEIRFEDLFIASTPINSYLTDALYEATAWQATNNGDDFNDMSKVDMSDFEDKAVMLINNYNTQKNNLLYNIGPNYITIYGLIDKRIIDVEYAENIMINIDLIDCINEVAMFKRFLTDESIFENDKIEDKGTIVFTPADEEYETRLNYGKIKDNVFLEEVVLDYDNKFLTDNELEIARNFIQKMSNETKSDLMNNTKSNRGVFFQREYQTWYDDEKNYTVVNVRTHQATCSTAYFQNDAFLDYIKLKAMPRGDTLLIGFEEFYQDKFPNLSILESKHEDYYLNEKGEIIARSYEEIQEYLRKEQMKNEEQNKTTNNIITNTIDVNNNTTNTKQKNNAVTNTNILPKTNTVD